MLRELNILPYQPESIETMRRRLPAAVAEIINAGAVAVGPPQNRPGLKRRHVFDFASGVRLIISAECYPRIEATYLHVSASAFPGCDAIIAAAGMAGGPDGIKDAFAEIAMSCFRDLSGVPLVGADGYVYNGHSFHWLLPRENIWRCLASQGDG